MPEQSPTYYKGCLEGSQLEPIPEEEVGDEIQPPYPVIADGDGIHGYDVLGIAVPHSQEGSFLPLHDLIVRHQVRYLDIGFPRTFRDHEVYLLPTLLPDVDRISSGYQLVVDYVLYEHPVVQPVLLTGCERMDRQVRKIGFVLGFEGLLPHDVVHLALGREVAGEYLVEVFPHGILLDIRAVRLDEIGNGIGAYLLAGYGCYEAYEPVQEVPVPDFAAGQYIFPFDLVEYGEYVLLLGRFRCVIESLREAPVDQVIVEIRAAVRRDAVQPAVLLHFEERERHDPEIHVSAGQLGDELSGQQIRVAPGDEYGHILLPVGFQYALESLDVLYLVDEQVSLSSGTFESGLYCFLQGIWICNAPVYLIIEIEIGNRCIG